MLSIERGTHMRLRKLAPMVALLLLALPLFTASVVAGPATLVEQAVGWQITDTRVVAAGTTTQLAQGTYTENFVIEGVAKAHIGRYLPDTIFRLTLSAFSPKNDMPGQPAGKWYVQGEWTLTARDADPQALLVRHNPYVVTGTFKTVLDYNPAAVRTKWTAAAELPMAQFLSRWARGEGSLTFDESLQGALFLDLTIWPVVR